MTSKRKSQGKRAAFAKLTTITLSATLSLAVSPTVAAKIQGAGSAAERIAVIRVAVRNGEISHKDGSSLNSAELKKMLANGPWGDYGWNKRFDDGRV